jgi:hypothetical protein
MIVGLLVFINTILLLLIAYPYIQRILSVRVPDVRKRDDEIPKGYDDGTGPIRIDDADSFDYSSVFGDSGWRNIIGTTKVAWGVDPSTETGASLL